MIRPFVYFADKQVTNPTIMMIQLEDLPDDCLLEVLEKMSPKQLMKMRLNRRLDRLANEKIRLKTNAIALNEINDLSFIYSIAFNKSTSRFFDCAHLDIDSDQVLVLKPKRSSVTKLGRSLLWKEKQLVLTILSECHNVKSIDFDDFEIPDQLLMEVFQRCPKIECVKFFASPSPVKEDWGKALSRFGRRIFEMRKKRTVNNETNDAANVLRNLSIEKKVPPEIRLLKLIVELRPNIKHVDMEINCPLTQDYVEMLKTLPTNCRIGIHCRAIQTLYEDVVDEFHVRKLNWFTFGDRVKRLSSLKFAHLPTNGGGVEFAGLKKLDITTDYTFNKRCLDGFFASRFPLLEEFCFSSNVEFTENNYITLFQQMRSVKKLIIYYQDYNYGDIAKSTFDYDGGDRCIWMTASLPLDSIHQLENLEIIDFQILRHNKSWRPKQIMKHLEQYIHVISLKKLTLKVYAFNNKFNCEEVRKELVNEVRRLKLLQCQVEVELFFKINMKLIRQKIDT